MKLITFVTTIYNIEKIYLEELFNSFEELVNHKYIEFIVVDDCSENNSAFLFLLEKYKKNKNFNFIKMEENTRRTGAFVKGIKASSGKYLMSLDSDDLVNPKSLKNYLKILENQNIDLILNSNLRRDVSKNDIWEEKMYYGSSLEKISDNWRDFNEWSTFTAFNTIVSGEIARNSEYNTIDVKAPHDDAYFGQVWISGSKTTLYTAEPFFIYNIFQIRQTFSGTNSMVHDKKKIDAHWKLSKEIIKLYDHKNNLTILNITSILSSHFRLIAKLEKKEYFLFWMKCKFYLPLSLRRNNLYRKSWFKLVAKSGLNFKYVEEEYENNK